MRHLFSPLALTLAVLVAMPAQAAESTNKIGITMVDIPAGSFKMGASSTKESQCLGSMGQSSATDSDASNNEGPVHRVSVLAFKMGKTEVTLGQFKQFIAATGRNGVIADNFMKFNASGDDAPVVQVNWNDAQDFIDWLNKTDGGGWRLPSEAEWEYACRAGSDDSYCGGNHIEDLGWYDKNSYGRPHAVGGKQANAFGLHDMSGNVWEWVQDCWHENYNGAPTDGSAWTSSCKESYRGWRGGSWANYASLTRAAIRRYSMTSNRSVYGGFRLARTL